MYFRTSVLSFILLLSSFKSYTQINIEGRIQNEDGIALFSTNITIKSTGEINRILGFSISKAVCSS